MYKFISLLFALFFAGCALSPNSAQVPAADNYAVMAPVLGPAETFFISLKDRKYGAAWDLLSAKSRKTIINDVYEASIELGEDLQEEDIEEDFESNGLLFNTYWDAFRNGFDPDMVLEDSRWQMGFIDSDEAEIIIQYKRSDHPARLKMFKENGGWKFGISETFGVRKF